MKRMRLFLISALFVALLATACSEDQGRRGAKERPKVTGVTVMSLGQAGNVQSLREVAATVKAGTQSVVSARTMGAVLSVHVKEGDRVKRGALLVSIDDRELRAKANAAEEALNEARRALSSATERRALAIKTYDRYRKLYEEKALSPQELDNFETQKNVAEHEYERVSAMVKQAEAGAEEARVWLGYGRVVSPISGVVTARRVEPGNMAAPGIQLIVIDDDSGFRAEAGFDESMLNEVKPGNKVRVEVPSINAKLEGTVVEVLPAIDPGSRTFIAKINISAKGLRSGQYAKVLVSSGTRSALTLPIESLVERGQLLGVYVVGDDNVITYRLVKTGRNYGKEVEIVSGLRPGDRVIVKGANRAADGALLVQEPGTVSAAPSERRQ